MEADNLMNKTVLVALIRTWETSTATDQPRFTEHDIGPGYGRRGMGHGMMGGGRGMGHGMMGRQDR